MVQKLVNETRGKAVFLSSLNGLDPKNLKKRNIRATEIQPFRVFGLQTVCSPLLRDKD